MWPEAEGVAYETEDVGWGFDGERFHGPSPSAAGGHRMCLSDSGVVLIHGVTAGFEGPECNLGNRERFKVSGGNKRRQERRTKLWIVTGAERPGCAEDPPSDDGNQNDKQRSCFWWFMKAGEWGGMIDRSADAGSLGWIELEQLEGPGDTA
ncbi:hypothetical protein StoSoilB5_21520 [Arthrobacter sp. StoSoilB5]|nr:hypothetical protein StoSoilB5_21520 [Arthrobacter sp. StoSoilB5]